MEFCFSWLKAGQKDLLLTHVIEFIKLHETLLKAISTGVA
jgi:hypothetical protein